MNRTMRGREWLMFLGGTAVASAFHEYGHHTWTMSTTLATLFGSLMLVMLILGPKKEAENAQEDDG